MTRGDIGEQRDEGSSDARRRLANNMEKQANEDALNGTREVARCMVEANPGNLEHTLSVETPEVVEEDGAVLDSRSYLPMISYFILISTFSNHGRNSFTP